MQRLSRKQVSYRPLAGVEEYYAPSVIALSQSEGVVPLDEKSYGSTSCGWVAEINDMVVGHCGITVVYSNETIELGALVTSPIARGRGIAPDLIKRVVESAIEDYSPTSILAFSNPSSRTLFEKMGAAQIENGFELPEEVWKLCSSCRFNPNTFKCGATNYLGELCCGRVYNLIDIDH
jgi:N-acetylglutamate synthase-like GNAT family acetyltransferase